MEKYQITKEDIKEAFLNPVRVRGMALKESLFEAIKIKAGSNAMEMIEKESNNLRYPFQVKNIKNFEWYPVGIIVEAFFVLQNKFNFQTKDFAELGEMMPKLSFMWRFLMSHLAFPEKLTKIIVTRIWRRNFDTGSVEIYDYQKSKKEGHYFLKVKDFKLHPLYFFYLGYIMVGITQMVERLKKVTVEETKSPFKGDEYQEYLIKWTK